MNSSMGVSRRHFSVLVSLIFCPILTGCGSAPPVNKVIARAPAEQESVIGPHGPLSRAQSRKIIARLEHQEKGTDLLQNHLAIERALVNAPLVTGNRTKLLHDGPETFRAIFKAIHNAKHYVLLEYYIFENVVSGGEHLADLLIQKRREGVEVAIIYDGYGSSGTPGTFFDRLRAAGVKIVEFHPLNPLKAHNGYSINDRDHRKILIADGTTAILGGVNLYTGYERHPPATVAAPQGGNPEKWHDIDIQIDGPAVRQLQRVFLDHWLAEGGGPLPAIADAPPPRDLGHEVVRIVGSNHTSTIPAYEATLLSAINSAEKSVWLTTAYFVPTTDELEDLEAAARRGVDVRLMLPGKSDSELALAVGHSDYGQLLKAGVKIFEYSGGILHSKCAVIDGVWSTVGSSNFDHRSVLFNDEVDAVILGRNTARQFKAQFERDESDARQITLAAWHDRSIMERLREFYSRMVENLL